MRGATTTAGLSVMGNSTATAFVPVTATVHPDEKAWRMKEVNLVRPINEKERAWRRVQFIWVQRDGVIYEWSRDLGPKEMYTAPQIDVPGLWEHTVGEMWDIADHYRWGDDYWQKRSAEIAAESTIIPDLLNQKEEQQKVIHNRSVFGPGVRKQRDGFPLRAVLAAERDRRATHGK